MERGQAGREVALHASQSGEARAGTGTGAVGLEQFPMLSVRRAGPGSRELSRVAGDHQATPARDVLRSFASTNPTHSQRTRMNGAPGTRLKPSPLSSSSQLRPQLVRGAEQRVLNRSLTGVKNAGYRSQAQAMVVLQLEHHPF